MKKVKIGGQIWMSENLNIDKFRNGDFITEAKTAEEWQQAGRKGTPAWCYYDNDPANGEKYGKLYNWYAVNDPRGLAPKGYHIPTDAEWTILTENLGDEAGKKMKSTSGWNNHGKGTNTSGFSGLPGGYRDEDGTFRTICVYGNWWSSTEDDTVPTILLDAWARSLYCDSGSVTRDYCNKWFGVSFRCLMD